MIEKYEHHGTLVSVDSDLKGKHRDHCLCYKCENFKPNSLENCMIAQDVFDNCTAYGIVTPVWECPKFVQIQF